MTIRGWVRTRRDSKAGISFVHLADGSSGLDVLRALQEQAPAIKVFVLTNFPSDAYRRASERFGARGFFDKSSEFERLREVLAAA